MKYLYHSGAGGQQVCEVKTRFLEKVNDKESAYHFWLEPPCR